MLQAIKKNTMPNAIFDINNNNNTVSSYYTINDVVTIVNSRLELNQNITVDYLRHTYGDLIENIDGREVIEEITGFRTIWGPQGARRIPTDWKLRPLVANHYELVLYNIFERVVGIENVSIQYQIDNIGHRYDFMIDYENKKYLIEFEGIGHFTVNRFGETVHPLEQFRNFDNPNYILIIWPYWIQRCELNLEVILGLKEEGLGAIWSSDYHFGQFPFENSYEIVQTLNQQFKIDRNNEVGYMYGPETENRNNPENPVIEEKILNNRAYTWTVDKLIPSGTPDNTEERKYWLPERLKNNGL
jgi:hypothetical protein